MLRLIMIAFILFSFQASSLANDAAVGLVGGDLQFKNLKGVQMLAEDLYISPTLVKVKYQFRNHTDQAIETLVSFPLTYYSDSDAAFDTKSQNPNQFKVIVNNQEVAFQTKRTTDANNSQETIQHYWNQIFPANQTITVEHSYKPIFDEWAGDLMSWSNQAEAADIAERLEKDFCAAKDFVASMKQKNLKPKVLHYILTTAQTWDGPIQDFKLTISKDGAYKDVLTPKEGFRTLPKEGNFEYISLCTELKLEKSGNNFIARMKNFVPKKDLDIAYMGKLGK